jgi:hypothetical protein
MHECNFSTAFYLLHAFVGYGAKNKCGNCFQSRHRDRRCLCLLFSKRGRSEFSYSLWRAALVATSPSPISWRVHSATANIEEGSLHSCQYCGAFIVPLPTENNNILGSKCVLQIFSWHRCQQLYVVDKRSLTDLCAPLAIRFQIADSRTRWHCNFKGFSQHWEERSFPKIFAPHS